MTAGRQTIRAYFAWMFVLLLLGQALIPVAHLTCATSECSRSAGEPHGSRPAHDTQDCPLCQLLLQGPELAPPTPEIAILAELPPAPITLRISLEPRTLRVPIDFTRRGPPLILA